MKNIKEVKCDGRTDGRMDGQTKRGVESRSTRLKKKGKEKVRIILLFVHQSTFSLCSIPVCVYWEFTFCLEMGYSLVLFFWSSSKVLLV